MKFMIISLALLLVAAALIHLPSFRKGVEQFANALIVNVTPKGRATFTADAAFTQRYLLATVGSTAASMAICGDASVPLGVVPDMTSSTDTDLSYPLPCNLLGLNEDTERMIANSAIARGDTVVAAANGLVQTLPGTTGTYWVVGRANSATAANGDQVEVIPAFPYKVVVA